MLTLKKTSKIDCWLIKQFKGELRELQFYFRKIPLHQQKFLVISVLSNSPWLRRNFKNVQNETTKLFSVGNTFRKRSNTTWRLGRGLLKPSEYRHMGGGGLAKSSYNVYSG